MTDVDDQAEPLPASGYRTYEVYQRERVGESAHQLNARELIGSEMLSDPYRLLTILREHHPCYRDWVGNRFWVTRYDDVTSLLVDDANFETRPKRVRFVGTSDHDETVMGGRDLGDLLPIETAVAGRIDSHLDAVIDRVLDDLAASDEPDLAIDVAARVPLDLWSRVLDLPDDRVADFAQQYWRLQRGAGWDPAARRDGIDAFHRLVAIIEPFLDERSRADSDGTDLLTVAAQLDLDDGPVTAHDIVVTLLETDHETLHGGLANLWCNLLRDDESFDQVRNDHRMVKFAWLETLRHSPPVHSVQRFARHEVERFGRLLPDGAMVQLSAAAANRDPRVFDDPDRFVVGRSDLCQREPRGQYRADGLPSGIAPALGPPSKHPAVPKERPRSRYAITRDIAVEVSTRLLDAHPDLRLVPGAVPTIRSLRLGEMSCCWSLPVVL